MPRMARLRSSRRRRQQRPPRRTARTAETANKADSIEPGRPKPAQRRARRQTQPRLPFGGWAWAPPGWVRAPAYPAGEARKYLLGLAGRGQHRCLRRDARAGQRAAGLTQAKAFEQVNVV